VNECVEILNGFLDYTVTQKSKQCKTQQHKNHPRSVAFYYTWPGNEVSLLYNAPQSTWGKPKLQYMCVKCYYNMSEC